MLLASAVGCVVGPYATLWASRSARLRDAALAVARRRWHARLALAGAGVGVGSLALGAAGGAGPAPPVATAWTVATLALAAFAHVELLVAADRLRAYPDGRALHYDGRAPSSWPATSARIVSAWGVVMRRHRLLWPAFAACGVLFATGPAVGVDGAARWLALALSGDALALALCCLPFPRLVAVPDGFVRAVGSHTSTG
jgi:hypothetical protein